MSARILLMVTASLALTLGACEKKPDSHAHDDGHDHAAAADTQHAAQGVTPGSYEDWCGEHQVPESMCTRCNPSLVAAFKATGDWCAEHGLPESQCKICNPGLQIVRPQKKQGNP